MNRNARMATTLAIGMILAGCGPGALSSSSPSAAPSGPTLAPPGTSSPAVTDTSSAPGASASPAWITVAIANPALDLDIPANWQQLQLAAVDKQLKGQLPTLTGDVAKAWQYVINLIDTGEARSMFEGPSAIVPFTATVQLVVLTNSDSLEAAVARQQESDAVLFGGAARTAVDSTLPIGPAISVTIVSQPTGGSPTQDIEYFVRLDGSTILLLGAAPANDTTFADLMAEMARSMARG
jgi:hypothetical protein